MVPTQISCLLFSPGVFYGRFLLAVVLIAILLYVVAQLRLFICSKVFLSPVFALLSLTMVTRYKVLQLYLKCAN